MFPILKNSLFISHLFEWIWRQNTKKRKENKKTDKHPDYTGKALVDGKVKSLSAWVNTAKSSGKQYLSLKISDFKPKTDTGHTYTSTTTQDAEIPF